MKKRVISAALITMGAVFALSSCTSKTKEDLTQCRWYTDITTDVKAKYNISFIDDLDNNARKLDMVTDVDQSSDHYTVYVSNTLEASAFKVSASIDSDLEKIGSNIKYYTGNYMTFSAGIYDSEITTITSLVYASENGLAQFNDKYGFEVGTSKSLSRSVASSSALQAYKAGTRNITFDVVYMPTYVVRQASGQEVLRAVVFVPVYAGFNAGDKAINEDGSLGDSKITKYSSVEVTFTDAGYVFDGNVVSEA